MAAAVVPQERVQRVPRVKGYHTSRNRDRAAVVAELRESNWTGRALIPDINRIARGTCQASFLWSVYYHTQGKPHEVRGKNWTPPEFTERMLPEDFAMEGGFTPQQMREEIDDACQPNAKTGRPALAARMAETGPDRYRFRLLRENWKAAPNAFIPRKGPGKEEDSSKAESEEKADTQETATARVVMLPGKAVKVLPGRRYEIEKSGCKAIEYHCSAPLSARVTAGVLHLTDPKGEQKASTREAATSRVVEFSRRNGASPPPARPGAAELRAMLGGLGIPCDDRMARRLAPTVPAGCHTQFIADLLTTRLQQAPRFKPAYLPKFFSENLREAWAEEGEAQQARDLQERLDRHLTSVPRSHRTREMLVEQYQKACQHGDEGDEDCRRYAAELRDAFPELAES